MRYIVTTFDQGYRARVPIVCDADSERWACAAVMLLGYGTLGLETTEGVTVLPMSILDPLTFYAAFEERFGVTLGRVSQQYAREIIGVLDSIRYADDAHPADVAGTDALDPYQVVRRAHEAAAALAGRLLMAETSPVGGDV